MDLLRLFWNDQHIGRFYENYFRHICWPIPINIFLVPVMVHIKVFRDCWKFQVQRIYGEHLKLTLIYGKRENLRYLIT